MDGQDGAIAEVGITRGRVAAAQLRGEAGTNLKFHQTLTRLGGYALRTHDPEQLQGLLISVGAIEIGSPYLFK